MKVIQSITLCVILSFFLFVNHFVSAQFAPQYGTVNVTASVPGCGDGIIQVGEECDGSNYNGTSCSSRGFAGGVLSCQSCIINTTLCILPPPGGSSSGGGGGGGGNQSQAKTFIVFSGKAYPGLKVTVLKDGDKAITTVSDSSANFYVYLAGVKPGKYNFSLYSEEANGRKSGLTTYPVAVTEGATIEIKDIFIVPTIGVDKQQVKKGETISIFGQTTPQAEVTIQVNSSEPFFKKVLADVRGTYLHKFDTSVLEIGDHSTKSKAEIEGDISEYGKEVNFKVGSVTELVEPLTECDTPADVNGDCRVNLVDFSIGAFWYQKSGSPEGVDLNNDGIINLVDFSIMAFYWTG